MTLRLISGLALCTGYLLAQSSDLVNSLEQALNNSYSAGVEKLDDKLLHTQVSESDLLAAGGLLGQHDRLREAARIFERCTELYPSSFEAHYDLSLARIGLADYDAALLSLKGLQPVDNEQKAAIAYLRGKVYLETNHLLEAQATLAEANALRPDEENYALDLGLAYIRSSAYEPAAQLLKRALQAHLNSAELQLELALADALAGSSVDAISLCRDLEKRGVGASLPRVITAFSFCSKGDFEACEQDASDGLASPNPHPYLYYLRARARWNSGHPDVSAILNDLSKAIRQMPSCSVCLLLRSRVYEASHEDSLALADGKRTVTIEPRSASAWYLLSRLERKAGKTQEAADALAHFRAIADDEATQEAQSLRAQFLK